MAHMYIADPVALSRLGRFGNVRACEKLLLDLAIPHGMPFILEDDGLPVRHANQWLRSLPVSGCPSRATWIAYTRDYLHWHRFLAARGRDPLVATQERDLVPYFAVLRLGDAVPEAAVSERTWNRRVAALDSYYRHALNKGLITVRPFNYRTVIAWRAGANAPEVVERNLAYEKNGSPDAMVVWLEKDYLDVLFDVGMSGLLPDGDDDPAFRGRNASRNRAFAEFLADTGLRAQEASHLLIYELPEVPATPKRYVRMTVPSPVTKGRKERWVIVTPATLRTIDSYVRLERDIVLRKEHGLWSPARPLVVAEPTATGGRVNGKKMLWSALSVKDRERLVLPDGGSPLVFLTTSGAPLTDWAEVFKVATQRCRRIGRDVDNFPNVTPHTLRHTFAMHMLRRLIDLLVQALRRREKETRAEIEMLAGYWRMYDPLTVLRDLMGHASVLTTQVYLDAGDLSRLYAALLDESEGWDDDMTG